MGRKDGIAVANGTAALDIAVEVLGIKENDEVIMPTFTIISCLGQIIRKKAKPVLVDTDPSTWNMDISQIEAKITIRTKAIMIVHIYGLPVDLDPVLTLAKKYGLKVIEDAAEMHGQTYKGRSCGSFGDISTFSFYPNKHITTGEGGMIVTNSKELAEECKSYRNLCFQPKKRFIHEKLGWNYRITNLQAALGLAQLEKLDEIIEKKRKIGGLYAKFFSDLQDKIQLPLLETNYAKNIYWVFGIVLKDKIPFNVEEVMRKLGSLGIGTRPFFYPMHLQPVFRKMNLFKNAKYPIAEKLAERGFYIPSGLALTEGQMVRVSNALHEVLK